MRKAEKKKFDVLTLDTTAPIPTMRVLYLGLALLAWPLHVAATILQNGQVRDDPYPGQAPRISLDDTWRTYEPNVPEISYKGRWDSQHISCTFSFQRELTF